MCFQKSIYQKFYDILRNCTYPAVTEEEFNSKTHRKKITTYCKRQHWHSRPLHGPILPSQESRCKAHPRSPQNCWQVYAALILAFEILLQGLRSLLWTANHDRALSATSNSVVWSNWTYSKIRNNVMATPWTSSIHFISSLYMTWTLRFPSLMNEIWMNDAPTSTGSLYGQQCIPLHRSLLKQMQSSFPDQTLLQ